MKNSEILQLSNKMQTKQQDIEQASARQQTLDDFVEEETLDIELPDPKDRVFYEVVMEKRKGDDAYLVTGNIKHFPTRPFIVTPRQMLNIILDDGSI